MKGATHTAQADKHCFSISPRSPATPSCSDHKWGTANAGQAQLAKGDHSMSHILVPFGSYIMYIYNIYIYTYTYSLRTHTHTHTHIYIYIITYISLHVYIYIYNYIYIYICVCACMFRVCFCSALAWSRTNLSSWNISVSSWPAHPKPQFHPHAKSAHALRDLQGAAVVNDLLVTLCPRNAYAMALRDEDDAEIFLQIHPRIGPKAIGDSQHTFRIVPAELDLGEAAWGENHGNWPELLFMVNGRWRSGDDPNQNHWKVAGSFK